MKSEVPEGLVAAWTATLARVADRPAIFNTRGEVQRTFHDIEMGARDFEARIERFGAGEVIAIQIGNHEHWPSILLACLRTKLVVLPLEQSMNERERNKVLELCAATAVVTVPGGRSATIMPRATSTKPEWDEAIPSLLKLTSGTTAAPRVIRFRSEQLLTDGEQICDTMGISESDLNFGAIPISHSYGFSNLITPLLARAVPMVLSEDRMPRAVLDALARTGSTVFPGMPVFYQAFCEMESVPQLSGLRLCISAGAPLSVATAKSFRQKFNQPIHSFYGSSECGGICYDREGATLEQGFVGAPMNGVELEWIEPEASASRVRVRSAAVAEGYFPEPDEEKLGGGWFIPDDLLAKTETGVRIVGRTSDIINVAGKKVNPTEVEAELLRCAGVREAVVFGRPSSRRNEEVAACVVTTEGVSESELLAFCRRHLSGWQVPKRIFVIDKIPVSERGKFSRRELAQKFAAPR